MPPSDEQYPEERSGALLSPPPPSSPPAGPPPAETQATSQSPARPATAPRPSGPRVAAGHALQQRATAALFLAMLSLFGLLAISNVSRGIVVAGFALAAGALAAWFAATSIGRARHQRTALPRGSIVALVISGIGIAISVVLLAGFALFGKQLSAYSHCLTGANTVAAQQACHSQFVNSLTSTVRGLRPGGGG